MKHLFFSCILLLCASYGRAQTTTATDDLNWMSTAAQTSVTSENILFCDGSSFNYTLKGIGAGADFRGDAVGVIFPANTGVGGAANTSLTYTITFDQFYSNIEIDFVDLDFNAVSNPIPNETVVFSTNPTGMLPSSISVTAGAAQLNTTGATKTVVPTLNNSDFTAKWTSPTNQVRFTYTRPTASGFGLQIAEIRVTKNHNTNADIVPQNAIGSTMMPSFYGPQEVFQFCKDDPIFADGSASTGETGYFLELQSFDLSAWAGNNLYSGWVSTNSPAPSNINVLNQLGTNVTPVIGQVYLMSLSTGSCWDSDNFFFEVVECCPESLTLIPNCDNGTITISNIPVGSTNVDIDWYYSNGGSSVLLKPSTVTITASQGFGTYTATASFTLPNGMLCTVSGSVVYSAESCCEINGPSIDQFGVSQTGTITVTNTPYGTQQIPITPCNFSFSARTKCEDHWYLAIEPFDPTSWAATGAPYFSQCYTGTFPNPISNLSGFTGYTMTSGQFYLISFGVNDGNCNAPLSQIEYQVIYYECLPKGPNTSSSAMRMGEFDFALMPNPAGISTTVQFDQTETGEAQLLSMDGKIMKSISFESSMEVNMNLEDVPSGMYMIQVNVGDQIISKKLIKE